MSVSVVGTLIFRIRYLFVLIAGSLDVACFVERYASPTWKLIAICPSSF